MQVFQRKVKKLFSNKLLNIFLILDIVLSIQNSEIYGAKTAMSTLVAAATTTTTSSLSVLNQTEGDVDTLPVSATPTSPNTSKISIPDARTKVNAAVSNTSRPSPPRVRLNKCCQLNEYLDETQTCMPDSSADDRWVPLIFLIQQRRYHQPQGTSTKFITFAPSMRPTTNTTTTTVDKRANTTTCTDIVDLTYFKSTPSSSNGKFVIFSNGSLYLSERSLLIEPRNYCVDRNAALVCLPQEAKALLQLKKCCGKYGSYDAANKKCTFGKQYTTGTIGKLKLPPLNESIYQTLYGLPECLVTGGSGTGGGYAIAGDWQEAKLDVLTGKLRLPHKNLSSAEYCLEHLHGHEETATLPSSPGVSLLVAPPPVKIIACSHHFAAQNLSADGSHMLVDQHLGSAGGTLSVDDEHAQQFRDAVLHVGLVISVVFLGATLVAGYMMPSVHHALHWRCQIYYVFCLFIGELLLTISLLNNGIRLDSAWCLLIASGMQFFFLAAFFWLNTMCFNIWWTFRDFRPSSLERNQELLRLRLYSAYAWGIPLLICAIAACVDQLPETQLLHPGFGVHRCWFNNERLSIFAYFFGPIGLLLCANIILFVSTTHQLTCGLWKRDDVKSTTEKTALGKVCLKLVVVMGVTWIVDVISWLVGGPHSVWFFTDLINALQGVFIFIVVGCQPQVWAACKRICCPRLLRHDITNTTNGVQHSSSSQGLPSMGGGIGAASAGVTGSTVATEFSTQNTSLGTISTTYANSADGNGNGNGNNHTSTGTGGIYVSQITPTTATQATQFKIPMETIC